LENFKLIQTEIKAKKPQKKRRKSASKEYGLYVRGIGRIQKMAVDNIAKKFLILLMLDVPTAMD